MARRDLAYCPDTGDITKIRGYRAGKVVGSLTPKGYIQVSLKLPCGKHVSALGHRVAFLLMTGEWPEPGLHVDHINREPSDNRWENLRLTTPRQNALNNSATNILKLSDGSWRAQVMRQFKTKAEAEEMASYLNAAANEWLSTNGYFHEEEDAA